MEIFIILVNSTSITSSFFFHGIINIILTILKKISEFLSVKLSSKNNIKVRGKTIKRK